MLGSYDPIRDVVYKYWMSLSESERFQMAAVLHDAERALIAKLIPSEISQEDLKSFVFYYMHGFEMPVMKKGGS
jgi:hypothetical protein